MSRGLLPDVCHIPISRSVTSNDILDIYIYIYTHAHILNTDNFFHIIIFFSVLFFSLTNPRPLAPSRDTAQWSSQQWLVP